MTSILKADTIQDTDGNNIINESSDTITIGASGDTIALAGTTVTGITQGITEADQFRLTADKSISSTNSTDGFVTANLERVDTTGQGTLGTGMTQSSGVFTFPSTGIWKVESINQWYNNGNSRWVQSNIFVTTNNSSYNSVALNYGFISQTSSSTTYTTVPTSSLIDVTDVSNVKVKFGYARADGSAVLNGNTGYSVTTFTFIRLGDT